VLDGAAECVMSCIRWFKVNKEDVGWDGLRLQGRESSVGFSFSPVLILLAARLWWTEAPKKYCDIIADQLAMGTETTYCRQNESTCNETVVFWVHAASTGAGRHGSLILNAGERAISAGVKSQQGLLVRRLQPQGEDLDTTITVHAMPAC
jgi:hypothetical protein